jgi:hypothetical protein
MNAVEELDMLVTNTAILCKNKGAIKIMYNPKIGNRSKQTNVTYHLVREMLNLDGFLSVGLNRLKVSQIYALKDLRKEFYGN